jgi:CDP-diacylglycerol---serine O-phosphatidyltransferase
LAKKNPSSYAYLVPCSMTFAGLFAGFIAFICLLNMQLNACCIALSCAILCDTVDGFLARLTGTTSLFGAHLDSLCDVINFGLLPAMLAFLFFLKPYGILGIIACFAYLMATTIRLARYNSTHASSSFQGLPCTAAASLLCSIIWYIHSALTTHTLLTYAPGIGVIVLILAALQVSTLTYPKTSLLLHTFAEQPKKRALVFLTLTILVSTYPLQSTIIILSLYSLSGFIRHPLTLPAANTTLH